MKKSEKQLHADLLEAVGQMKRGEAARMHIVEDETAAEEDDSFSLRIYRTDAGKWRGSLIGSDGKVFGAIDVDCDSPDRVKRLTRESGVFADRIEVESMGTPGVFELDPDSLHLKRTHGPRDVDVVVTVPEAMAEAFEVFCEEHGYSLDEGFAVVLRRAKIA